MVSEKDYLLVSDLARVIDVMSILRKVSPETSTVIPEGEYRAIMRALKKWEREMWREMGNDEEE